jgi:hypothetical protein
VLALLRSTPSAISLLGLLAGSDPLPSAGWIVKYSTNVFLFPFGSGGFSFVFPDASGSAHYIVRPSSALTGNSLVAQIEVDGFDPGFNFRIAADNVCDSPPANVRLFFQRAGDDMSGAGQHEFYRWWSNPISYVLAIGSATLTVPLTPDQWSSVYGKFGIENPAMFQAALENAGAVGVTFGGGCFMGHGVNVIGGSATFILKNYTME